MRLGKYLSSLTKPELEELHDLLNLTDDEDAVYKRLAKGKSKTQISSECLVSVSSVDNRIRDINYKISKLRSGGIERFVRQ